jgi:hypothetical protein
MSGLAENKMIIYFNLRYKIKTQKTSKINYLKNIKIICIIQIHARIQL